MFCTCKACKKAKRKGLALGSRRMGFWIKSFNGDHYEYYLGNVSAYVRHPKLARGRARKQRVHAIQIEC